MEERYEYSARPTRLRGGKWGAIVDGLVSVGDIVEVRTRSGETFRAEVTRVHHADERYSVVSTKRLEEA